MVFEKVLYIFSISVMLTFVSKKCGSYLEVVSAMFQEFMLDHATDDEREFLASVLIRGNGLIKSAKELSNDKQSIELIASPSMKPPVESSEIDKERVQMNTQRKFQLELPKLVELFEMKHILSYFSLW